MESEKLYEITAYTENQVGLLSSIAGIFTRRSINIENLQVYPSKIPGIHKFKIKAMSTEEKMRAVVLQIDKKVDVVKAFYKPADDRSLREIAEVAAFIEKREKTFK